MLRQRLDESDPVLVKRVDDYYDGRIGMLVLAANTNTRLPLNLSYLTRRLGNTT